MAQNTTKHLHFIPRMAQNTVKHVHCITRMAQYIIKKIIVHRYTEHNETFALYKTDGAEHTKTRPFCKTDGQNTVKHMYFIIRMA